MISLIQRVREASVDIADERVASIKTGLLALWCVERGDTDKTMRRMVDRVLAYRVFPDADGRMNHSLPDIGGELLMVPQFTLAADTRKGNRPSFSASADPDLGRQLFTDACDYAASRLACVERGRFGADMQVGLVNDGPVTFWLRVDPG